MKTKHLLLQVAFVALLLLLPVATTQAQSMLSLSLTTPLRFGTPGQSTAPFRGIITNTGNTSLFVDFISGSVNDNDNDIFTDQFTFDFNPFFNNNEVQANGGFFLNPGANTGDITLFNIVIASSTRGGTIGDGLVFVSDTFNNTDSNNAPFQVAAIPEPTTMLLLGISSLGVMAMYGRKRRQESQQEESC